MITMNNKKSNMTTIPLRKETRDELRELKIYSRETYDEVVVRLINKTKEGDIKNE